MQTTRCKEQLSHVKRLGARRCNAIEKKVDAFLVEYPSWREYPSWKTQDVNYMIAEGVPEDKWSMEASFADCVWMDAIRDLGKGYGDEDYEIYALRYAKGEFDLLPDITLGMRLRSIAYRVKKFFVPRKERMFFDDNPFQARSSSSNTKSFADFEF